LAGRLLSLAKKYGSAKEWLYRSSLFLLMLCRDLEIYRRRHNSCASFHHLDFVAPHEILSILARPLLKEAKYRTFIFRGTKVRRWRQPGNTPYREEILLTIPQRPLRRWRGLPLKLQVYRNCASLWPALWSRHRSLVTQQQNQRPCS
jgi:hypothetical protein